jgi:hypothetical protein
MAGFFNHKKPVRVPLLDKIDIHIVVPSVDYENFAANA